MAFGAYTDPTMPSRDAIPIATTARTIRARVTRGVLTPIEPLDLPEGSEVDVTVDAGFSEEDVAASRAAAGGWKGAVDAEALIRNIYDDRLILTRPTPRL